MSDELVNRDVVRETMKKIQSMDSDTFKFSPGKNVIRIVPSKDASGFYYECMFHFKIADTSFPCPLHFDQPCRVCEVLATSKNKDLSRYRARLVFFMYVIDRNSKDNAPKRLMITSKRLMGNILTFIADPMYADLIHPEKGRDLIVEVTKTPNLTQYTVYPQANSSPLGDVDLDSLPPFEELITAPAEEVVNNAADTLLGLKPQEGVVNTFFG